MKNRILTILLLALAALTANAQGDFNPALPGEPNATYKVTVGISTPSAGNVYGGGSYRQGQQITIRRSDAYFSESSSVFYKFKHWTLNGEEYTQAGTSLSFTYTVGTENAAFEAVYEEEDPDNVTSKVFLVAEPADACTFNRTSGQRYMEENYAYLYYYNSSEAFRFQGWYDGETLVSTNSNIYYFVGKDDVTLTARFSYEPVIPGEPVGGEQDNIDNGLKGDVNGDGTMNVSDAIQIINAILGDKVGSLNNRICDMNADGVVNVSDAIQIINIILKGN